MTTHVPARQPFAALDNARLQRLTSMKNTQNAIVPNSFSSPVKPTLASPTKRRFAPSTFEDDLDTENIDPSIFNSPTKRSKNIDGVPIKTPKFILTDAPKPVSISTSSPLGQKRKTLSLSVPTTTNATPISASRGSPKHKRVGILSKRRASSSPFRRIDPPSFTKPSSVSGGLPFSIDAALSGTIPSYTPKQEVASEPEPVVAYQEKPMPKSWFFAIHEDTPEEEATNLMEHSALTLDISSDDDAETKRSREQERGKENIPPPDFTAPAGNSNARTSAVDAVAAVEESSKDLNVRLRKERRLASGPDAMTEDRSPLGDLPAEEYHAEDAELEDVTAQKLSKLSQECTFDFVAPAAAESVVDTIASGLQEEKGIVICEDDTAPTNVTEIPISV